MDRAWIHWRELPTGRVVNTQYNNAMQPTQVTFASFSGTSVGYNYLSSASYAPTGAPASLTFGTGITETDCYNKRLQPGNMQLTNGAFTWLNRTYNFYSSGTGGCSASSSGNDGNVISIADNLQPNRTQMFGYDNLNRISTAQSAATSGADCWGQSFGYDAWANLLAENVTKCSGTQLSVGVNAHNQITNSGVSYDAGGDLLADGLNTYVYDAEGRITSLNSGADSYVYGPDGTRVRKTTGSGATEYIYFSGQPLSEYNPANGDWSDYIYSGSRRIAKADNFDYPMYMTGTNCSACGWQTTAYNFTSLPLDLSTRLVQTGDKLFVSQYQAGARGGLGILFTDGTYSNWNLLDQNGNALNDDPNQGIWDNRRFALDAYAGKQISVIFITVDGNTPAGSWQLYMQAVVYVGTDGTVYPLFTQETTAAVGPAWGTSGVTNRTFQVQHGTGVGQFPNNTTYYHADHLGSARLLTHWEGWPLWSGTFLPFGQEWNPEITTNHYKFTGYERDAESGNDNALARYFSSQYARFLSPDPLDGDTTDPQTLNRYAYVRDNPLNFVDPTGMDFNCYSVETADQPMTVCYDGGSGGGDCASSDSICSARKNPPPKLVPGSPKQPPKQTFSQCMAANAKNFSLVGAFDGMFNAIGIQSDLRNTWAGQFFGGNSITGILYGDNGETSASLCLSRL